MKREAILQILRQIKPELEEKFRVSRIGLFGSCARDEATEKSDVDVVVVMPPDGFEMVHLRERLEEAFHLPVDLVRYRPKMNGFLKSRIDEEAVYA